MAKDLKTYYRRIHFPVSTGNSDSPAGTSEGGDSFLFRCERGIRPQMGTGVAGTCENTKQSNCATPKNNQSPGGAGRGRNGNLPHAPNRGNGRRGIVGRY